MNYAVVGLAGEVVNVVVLAEGSTWQPPEGCKLVPCSENGGIGWKVSGKKWKSPKQDKPKRAEPMADEVGFDRAFVEGE